MNRASIRLRPTVSSDIRLLHTFECDAMANQLAGTKPRTWEVFRARWDEILADPSGSSTGVTPRAILVDGVLAGAINVWPHEGRPNIGYWIGREHWGRGIASAALQLMLNEFSARPLFASAAAENRPSLRVLEKAGFIVESRQWMPETERYLARDVVTLVLGEGG
ncbi:MAG: GNAT family N-acetyltransferase [Planctomycetes bacterium]|nr:GNAT family N-acetyltransferase [Planctomycetota bacterium]